MWKKEGLWYADWRDENGKRHRRAFPTRNAALNHETKQKKAKLLKKAHSLARLLKSASQSGAKRGRAITSAPSARTQHKPGKRSVLTN